MNRVTRTQFVSALVDLPYQLKTIRGEGGTVNYYHPDDTDRRDLLALRKVEQGKVIFYLCAKLDGFGQ